MAVQIFTGNTIALMWDFDGTLAPGYMQEHLFGPRGIESRDFWKQVNGEYAELTARGKSVNRDTLYLDHILREVRGGRLEGLSEAELERAGAAIEFFPGLQDLVDRLDGIVRERPAWGDLAIRVEHYVISAGFGAMIRGSSFGKLLAARHSIDTAEGPVEHTWLWANEFLEDASGQLSGIAYPIDHTTKTRAVWEINKGSNVDPLIDVNALIPQEKRRVPIPNMVYIADGATDIPVFSTVNQYGGRTLGVYTTTDDPEQSRRSYGAVKQLSDAGRVQHFAAADYRAGTEVSRWLEQSVREIAQTIERHHQLERATHVRPPVGHLPEPPANGPGIGR